MIQVKRLRRKTKHYGFWLQSYDDYEKDVNDFLRTVKVIQVQSHVSDGRITFVVVYDDEKGN